VIPSPSRLPSSRASPPSQARLPLVSLPSLSFKFQHRFRATEARPRHSSNKQSSLHHLRLISAHLASPSSCTRVTHPLSDKSSLAHFPSLSPHSYVLAHLSRFTDVFAWQCLLIPFIRQHTLACLAFSPLTGFQVSLQDKTGNFPSVALDYLHVPRRRKE
jgi:hypothetical protein